MSEEKSALSSVYGLCVLKIKVLPTPHVLDKQAQARETRQVFFFSTPDIDASIMDSDEDTTMMDVDFPTSLSKGKGKAVNHDVPIDNDNLPWYLSFIELGAASLSFHTEGSKNTDQ